MKNILFITIFSFLLTSCMEAPARYRPMSSPESAPSGTNGFGDPITQPGTIPGQTTGGDIKDSTTPTTPGYEGCDLSYKHYTADIGYFGLCQNTYDTTSFRVKFSQTSSIQVCLVPTSKELNGDSTYIGNPQCILVGETGKVYEGKLTKDRPGYQNKSLNGVMVMKLPLLSDYIGCMQAFTKWPANKCPQGAQSNSTCYSYYANCPQGATSNQACYNQASIHKNTVCTQFKSRYSSSYKDITLF